jgi:hypothetical protein
MKAAFSTFLGIIQIPGKAGLSQKTGRARPGGVLQRRMQSSNGVVAGSIPSSFGGRMLSSDSWRTRVAISTLPLKHDVDLIFPGAGTNVQKYRWRGHTCGTRVAAVSLVGVESSGLLRVFLAPVRSLVTEERCCLLLDSLLSVVR